MVALFTYKKAAYPAELPIYSQKALAISVPAPLKLSMFFKNLGRLITFLSRFTFAFTAKYLKCAAGGIPQNKKPRRLIWQTGNF